MSSSRCSEVRALATALVALMGLLASTGVAAAQGGGGTTILLLYVLLGVVALAAAFGAFVWLRARRRDDYDPLG